MGWRQFGVVVILRDMFVRLGLTTDSASFAKGQLAVNGITFALQKLVQVGTDALRSFVDNIQGVANYSDEIQQLAQKTGLGTDSIQRLGKAAAEEGIGIEDFGHSIVLFSRSLTAAKDGSEESEKAFHKLGIRIKDAHGKLRPTDELFLDVADKFSKMKDGAEKTATALHLFGRSGAELIPVLNKGKDGLEEFMGAAVMTPEEIQAGKEVVVTQRQIVEQTKRLWREAIAPLLPAIRDLLKRYLEWRKQNGEIMKQRIRAVVEGIIVAVKALAETFNFLGRNMDVILVSIAAVTAALIVMNASAIAAAAATSAAWMEAAAPFLLIGTAIAGFLLMFDDLRMYAKYGDKAKTITGDFVNLLEEFTKPKGGDPWWLTTIREFADTIKEALKLLHELNGETAKTNNGAFAGRVTQASPAFKRAAAMTPKNQVQIAQEEGQIVGGRLDAERKAGFVEGLFWAITKPDFDFRNKPSLSSASLPSTPNAELRATTSGSKTVNVHVSPEFHMNIDAGNMTPDQLRPMIREEFQSMTDTIHENALAAVSE